jgi:hypothetical protein
VTIRPGIRLDPHGSDSHKDDYARVKLMLHVPFRGDPDSLRRHPETDELLSWWTAYDRKLDAGWVIPADSLPSPRDDAAAAEPEFEPAAPGQAERELAADYQRLAALGGDGEDALEVPLDDQLGRRDIDLAHDWFADPPFDDDELKAAASWIDQQKRELGDDSTETALPPVDTTLLYGPQRDVFVTVIAHARLEIEGANPAQLLLNVDGSAGTGPSFPRANTEAAQASPT